MSQQTDSRPVIPDPDTQGPVDYGHNVTFEWIEDGRIAVFSLKDTSRTSVDAFFMVNLAFAEQNRGKTIYIFNDAMSPNIALTQYFRQKLTKLAEVFEEFDITAVIASVIQPGLFSTIAKLFSNFLSKSAPRSTQRFFNDYDEALNWLKTHLPEA